MGIIHALEPVTATLWAVAGAHGIALVDVRLDVVDTTVDVGAVVSLAAGATLLVAGDLAGSIHVMPLGQEDVARQLTGYPDRVRNLGLCPDERFLVAAADDEITWWTVDGTELAEQPVVGVAHDAPITTLDVGPHALVATGDAGGLINVWCSALADHPVVRLVVDGEVTALAWSPDGRGLAAGTIDGHVAVWSVDAGLLA